MPIISTDIKIRLSGGASNADPNASIGGAKSTTEWSTNIFDDVAGSESADGDVEYRCVYVHNGHASLILQDAVAWLPTNTANADTELAAAVGASPLNGVESAIANENTAPAGLTFSVVANEGAALALGSIPAGQHRAVWLRRTVTAGAAASADTGVLRVKGASAA